MQIARANLAALCQQYGSTLQLPAGLDGVQLLWALAGNESSFGVDITPRHEAGYCRGGRYFDARATQSWGCLAHCSYGPWQVMFANFPLGSSPLLIMASPALVANAAAALIALHIVGRLQADTLEKIADAYNSGDWHHKTAQGVPTKYIADLVKNYHAPLGVMA